MKISILLIEDDRDMRDLISRHLQHSGFDVQKAEDGIRASISSSIFARFNTLGSYAA